jgi:hypothetical protein
MNNDVSSYSFIINGQVLVKETHFFWIIQIVLLNDYEFS